MQPVGNRRPGGAASLPYGMEQKLLGAKGRSHAQGAAVGALFAANGGLRGPISKECGMMRYKARG